MCIIVFLPLSLVLQATMLCCSSSRVLMELLEMDGVYRILGLANPFLQQPLPHQLPPHPRPRPEPSLRQLRQLRLQLLQQLPRWPHLLLQLPRWPQLLLQLLRWPPQPVLLMLSPPPLMELRLLLRREQARGTKKFTQKDFHFISECQGIRWWNGNPFVWIFVQLQQHFSWTYFNKWNTYHRNYWNHRNFRWWGTSNRKGSIECCDAQGVLDSLTVVDGFYYCNVKSLIQVVLSFASFSPNRVSGFDSKGLQPNNNVDISEGNILIQRYLTTYALLIIKLALGKVMRSLVIPMICSIKLLLGICIYKRKPVPSIILR